MRFFRLGPGREVSKNKKDIKFLQMEYGSKGRDEEAKLEKDIKSFLEKGK